MDNMDHVRNFLDKKDRTIPDKVLDKMNEESKKLNFEMAAKYRDYYRALSIISERQYVTETTGDDMDIIAFSKGTSIIVVQVFFMRKGHIVDREHLSLIHI